MSARRMAVLGLATGLFMTFPALPSQADTGVYHRVMPRNCNYENAPRAGCVIATTYGKRQIMVQPLRRNQRVTFLTLWRNGEFFARYKLRGGSGAIIARQPGRYVAKVKFTSPTIGVSRATTKFTVSHW